MTDAGTPSGPSFPDAEVGGNRPTVVRALRQNPSRFWWLTGICVIVALVLALSAIRTGGTRIKVRFQQGHGIKPGDVLRHRGIDVGEVVAVELDSQLVGVDVAIELTPAAAGLAREGSRFWIERPRVSLARISGLETVVGAKYVGVLPGPTDAQPQFFFDGEEAPLTVLEANVLPVDIRFKDGHGLSVGDPLKHRGIIVGEVVHVELTPGLSSVRVQVRLAESAHRVARAGSQFWIERPEVGLSGVRGLETIVGGRYIAVVPGPEDAQPLAEFDGLEQPPSTIEREEGGVEVVLEASDREGVESGAPITYRGLQVGHIVAVRLSPDATQVEARAYVRPAFRELARENTVFWSTSGINLNFGITGLELSADTLKTIAAGGVAMAVPVPPGKLASSGQRYRLNDKAANNWLEWAPRIALGTQFLPDGGRLPNPIHVKLIWKEKLLGVGRSQEQSGWTVLMEGGELVGPIELLKPPENAVAGSASLQFEGDSMPVEPNNIRVVSGLAAFSIGTDTIGDLDAWEKSKIRIPDKPEDCLIVTGARHTLLPLSSNRLSAVEGGWKIDPSFTLNEDAHGGCVVSTGDGRIVGLVIINKGQARVAFPNVVWPG